MSAALLGLEERCLNSLRRYLEAGDEISLHQAYELAREALASGLGVMDMALVLWRAARSASAAGPNGGEVVARRAESFLLEWLSPFEMTHRGAREANQALRRLDDRREEEARRIAQELHDQVSQLLATAHVALEGIRSHLASGGEAGLAQAVGVLHQAADEIRRLSHELRPVILDDLGLAPALRFLGKGAAQRSGLKVTVTGSTNGRLPPAIEIAVYRAAQEALSNVARHARATCATLELEHTERDLKCRVRDDGRGFDPDTVFAPGARSGIGLDCIRERIAPLGGRLEVTSRPGHGTELLVHIPLEITHAHAPSHRG